MEVERKGGATKCLRCMRTKEEAISEQVSAGEPCDISSCQFRHEILDAIEKVKNPPMKIKRREGNNMNQTPMKISKRDK